MKDLHPFTIAAIGAGVALMCVAYPPLFFLLLTGVALSIVGAALDRAHLQWRLYKAKRWGDKR